MFPFNNPTFWEYVGAILVAGAVAPFVYMLYVAGRLAIDDLKELYRPTVSLDDPVFGELRFFKFGWLGEVDFSANQSGISIFIGASESGPTDQQRDLYKQIELKYNDLFPEIEKALRNFIDNDLLPTFRDDFVDYVDHDWEFDLCGIEISDGSESGRWSAEYSAIDEEDGDMTYTVEIVNWVVGEVTGDD
jgi:hypothetical protein